jgi:hypothetical protein
MQVKPGHTHTGWQHQRSSSGRIGFLLLLLGCIALGVLVYRQWLNLSHGNRYLEASLLAKSTANYNQSQPTTQVAQVKLEIIGDMLRDSQLDPEVLAQRLAWVTAVLLSPVPQATPLPGSKNTLDLKATPTPVRKATATPTSSSTATVTASASATASATATSLPTATRPIPTKTAVSVYSSIPTRLATPSAVPSSPTLKPGEFPTRTPTPRRTHKPTSSITPTGTPPPTHTTRPTNTLIPTFTPTRTVTLTPAQPPTMTAPPKR